MSSGVEPHLRAVELDDAPREHREKLRADLGSLLDAHPGTTLDHEPGWLDGIRDDTSRRVQIWLCIDDENRIVGYLPLVAIATALDFELGELRLYRFPVRRYTLSAEPIVFVSEWSEALVVETLLQAVFRSRGRQGVVFSIGLSVDGPIARALASSAHVRARNLVVPRGRLYPRRLISLPEDFAAYMQGLGSRTRQDLRRHRRRLEEKFEGRLECRAYASPEDVEGFLSAAAEVSRRTYQARILGLGVEDGEASRLRFGNAAVHGWMRCYVLFGDERPIAFMSGYLHRRVYYSTDIGYDPPLAKYSPGNVLHQYVLEDLFGVGERVESFDFLYGDNSNKTRLSNESRETRNVYVFEKTVRWRVFVTTWRLTDWMSESVGTVLDSMGLKTRLKRFLRRWISD